MDSVREIIKKYCKEKGITQVELARRANLHPQVISDLCHGRRSAGDVVGKRIVKATEGEITMKDLRPDLLEMLEGPSA